MNKEICGTVKERLEDYFKESLAMKRLFARLKKNEGNINYEISNFSAQEYTSQNLRKGIVLNACLVDSENKENALYAIHSHIDVDKNYSQVYTCINSSRSGSNRMYMETIYDLGEGLVLSKMERRFPYEDSQLIGLQICEKKNPMFMSTDVVLDGLESTVFGRKFRQNKMSIETLIAEIQDDLGIERFEKESD